ncbi:hypothetical protein KDA_40350 [Dictyobacter alpinus]|uniref:Uncharacterized protein n=1 Tax=Dictyobacter alpinus TaxID=2014873 RepID=A0A402BAV0_9CHLR|nr:hypothetical protein KDA_40350 [Dictyobacter alpinus]
MGRNIAPDKKYPPEQNMEQTSIVTSHAPSLHKSKDLSALDMAVSKKYTECSTNKASNRKQVKRYDNFFSSSNARLQKNLNWKQQ